jgi:acetylornithine/N-succinyldiaminopimelate aminotransferase
MTFDELKQLDDQYVIGTYARFPVAIDHGEGAVLSDLDGRRYIDFSSGIGVCSVGYANPKWVDAVIEQTMKLGHISNLFYTAPNASLAEKLCKRSGMAASFFSNSGAEANEGMIKLARKYSFDKYGKGRGTVLTLNNSFHGRTSATLAATGQDIFHQYFFPFPDGFRHADPDMESIQSVSGHDVCAVLVELVQGEGGVLPLGREFVHALAVLCAERDWLLLVDEVQTGIGRTGSLFAFQQYGILPDAVSFAKGIGGGLPLGGFLTNERCRKVLGPGTHAATFGGNPVCAAAGLAVLDILDEDMMAAVKEKGNYLRRAIAGMGSPYVAGTRGMGLMIGVSVRGISNKELAGLLIKGGLLCLTAGHDTLRLLPPLTITKAELDEGLEIMRRVMLPEGQLALEYEGV